MDIEHQAIRHQGQAAFYAEEAAAAMPADPELAKHCQNMVRFHHQRASVFLLALLLRDKASRTSWPRWAHCKSNQRV